MSLFLEQALFGKVAVACVALGFAVWVALRDLASHRIPNRLTVTGAAIGLALNGVLFGAAGLIQGGLGLLVGLAVFLPLFLARGFGAGDVKAMAGVGACLGPHGALCAALWTLIAGMVGGMLMLASGSAAAPCALFRRWMFRVYVLGTTGGRARLAPEPGDPARRRFPYGLAIACGTLIYLVWS